MWLQCSTVFSTSISARFAPPCSGLALCTSIQTIGSREPDTLPHNIAHAPSIHSPHRLSPAECIRVTVRVGVRIGVGVRVKVGFRVGAGVRVRVRVRVRGKVRVKS